MIDRRDFLGGMGVLSLAVTFGCGPNGRDRMIRRADETGELAPNMYVTVMPDGRIALALNKSEIGQGVSTGYCTLVAEELDVECDAVDFHFADSFPEYRTSFMMQQTGGSTSTAEGFLPLRRAAAAAREMLVAAAAAEWGVDVKECSTAGGAVKHASGKSAGYGELTKLAAHQGVPHSPKLRDAKDFRLIGKAKGRVDALAKVTGTATFGIDVVVPDMVRACVLHGPRYGARAKAVRADAAKQMRGVIDVFAFDGGVAVVADKYWQALAASRAVEVDWDDGLTKGLDTEELREAMLAYHGKGNAVKQSGHAGKTLAHAKHKVEAAYEAPFLAHATMEPQNCTVHVKGRHVEVWAPTQSPSIVQEFVAHAVGTKRDKVLVHTTYCGGGFGRRGVADSCAQAARIAKKVGRPVQMIWSRESDMTQAFYRPQAAAALRGALDDDGAVTAVAAHIVCQSIVVDSGPLVHAVMPGLPRALENLVVSNLMAMMTTNSVPDVFGSEGIRNSPYRFRNFHVESTPVETGLSVAAWRSVGNGFNAFAIESFVDELAHAAGKDPLEMRRSLLAPDGRERAVLDTVAKLSGWGTPPATGVGRGIARHTCFGTEVAEVAEVAIVDGRIKVRKVWCAVGCGTAVNPDVVRAQMEGAIIYGLSAALDQQITTVDGVVQQKNFDAFPPLRMFECPEITVAVMKSDDDPSGVGEPGLPPIAPAVANAIFAATGVRLRRLPLQQSWSNR